jgi:hypothetical protein
MRATLLTFAALAIISIMPLNAQAVFPEKNGAVLAGVDAVDAYIVVATWMNVAGDRERFADNAQAAFRLGLRRDGVRVEVSAPNYLICELSMAQSGGVVAYHYRLRYHTWAPSGVHALQWETGGMVTVGRSNFGHEGAAQVCVDDFSSEWLKWNPRR